VYTPQGILNAVRAGVRSIEHGNFIDEEAAACMQQAGAYFVPTLTTYFLLSAYGAAEKIPAHMLAKIDKAKERGLQSLEIARAAGLKICSGSDVLSSMQPFKSMELGLKAQVLGAHAAIVSATRTNAELFGLADAIGTVEAGKRADLIVVEGHPLENIAVLQDAANVVLVMRDGEVLKDTLSPRA
jgi:imidazolonepropionase-like amidohydrolase